MASFRCYDSSDVSAILIMTNFPLYLMQLWWQFFPNACLWRRSFCSNLAGIDPEKLYRATFICQYGLCCCMALVSFRLFCKNLGNLQEFLGKWITAPLAKNCPYAYVRTYLHASRLCFWIAFLSSKGLTDFYGFWHPYWGIVELKDNVIYFLVGIKTFEISAYI